MRTKLLLQAIIKFTMGLIMVGALLFLPAGGFVLFLFYPLLLVKRIRNEEAVLEEGLPGYKEYKQKVKYRMIPFIW